MQTKISQEYFEHVRRFAVRLNDVRFAGQVLFVVIILLISWSGVKAIQTNYGLQKQISALKEQNSIQKLEDGNLALQNQYYQSNQYLELAARQDFGMAQPGEKEVIVPRSVALAYTVDVPTDDPSATSSPQTSAFQKHLTGWLNFFLHRPQAN